jgi:uncharacterized membrane protein required for colicin V production
VLFLCGAIYIFCMAAIFLFTLAIAFLQSVKTPPFSPPNRYLLGENRKSTYATVEAL